MSYVPGHLRFLDNTGAADGWPKGIDEEGKQFAIQRIKAGMRKYTQLDLDLAKRCIYDHYIDNEPIPECLKGSLWDWLYAVTYRAILHVGLNQVFISRQEF